MRPNSLCARFLFLSVCAAGRPASGTLFEYEGFSYPSGSSLSSANCWSGWSGGSGSPGGLDATVTATSLTFQNLAVSGGAVSSAGFQPPAMGSSVAYWAANLDQHRRRQHHRLYELPAATRRRVRLLRRVEHRQRPVCRGFGQPIVLWTGGSARRPEPVERSRSGGDTRMVCHPVRFPARQRPGFAVSEPHRGSPNPPSPQRCKPISTWARLHR